MILYAQWRPTILASRECRDRQKSGGLRPHLRREAHIGLAPHCIDEPLHQLDPTQRVPSIDKIELEAFEAERLSCHAAWICGLPVRIVELHGRMPPRSASARPCTCG